MAAALKISVLATILLLLACQASARPVHHPAGSLGGAEAIPRTTPASTAFPRPPHQDGARMARWLAHVVDYGTLATVALTKDFPVVGGSVSHSDGAVDAPSGRIYFYLTPMDELTQNVEVHPTASYTLTEAQLPGGCGSHDPEDPVCAKATFLGQVVRVPDDQVDAAKAAMFARHPVMATWPPRHNFALYELQVQQVHLLDYYGGMKIVDHAAYYAADLEPAGATA